MDPARRGVALEAGLTQAEREKAEGGANQRGDDAIVADRSPRLAA